LRIKLGLRPYCPTRGPYIQREAQPHAKTGNNSKPIRGKLKLKGAIRSQGIIAS
jgi:hypothetical protein